MVLTSVPNCDNLLSKFYADAGGINVDSDGKHDDRATVRGSRCPNFWY